MCVDKVEPKAPLALSVGLLAVLLYISTSSIGQRRDDLPCNLAFLHRLDINVSNCRPESVPWGSYISDGAPWTLLELPVKFNGRMVLTCK